MTSKQISADSYWLRDLSEMGAPIQFPYSAQLRSFQRLQLRGLVEYRWHDGWDRGWTITHDGKRELAS